MTNPDTASTAGAASSMPLHDLSADQIADETRLTEGQIAEYKLTVVAGIETMLTRDAEQNLLEQVAYIGVDQITLDGLLVLDRITPEQHADCAIGEAVEDVPFMIAGTEHKFPVVFEDTEIDGFASCDITGKFVLPPSDKDAATA